MWNQTLDQRQIGLDVFPIRSTGELCAMKVCYIP